MLIGLIVFSSCLALIATWYHFYFMTHYIDKCKIFYFPWKPSAASYLWVDDVLLNPHYVSVVLVFFILTLSQKKKQCFLLSKARGLSILLFLGVGVGVVQFPAWESNPAILLLIIVFSFSFCFSFLAVHPLLFSLQVFAVASLFFSPKYSPQNPISVNHSYSEYRQRKYPKMKCPALIGIPAFLSISHCISVSSLSTSALAVRWNLSCLKLNEYIPWKHVSLFCVLPYSWFFFLFWS